MRPRPLWAVSLAFLAAGPAALGFAGPCSGLPERAPAPTLESVRALAGPSGGASEPLREQLARSFERVRRLEQGFTDESPPVPHAAASLYAELRPEGDWDRVREALLADCAEDGPAAESAGAALGLLARRHDGLKGLAMILAGLADLHARAQDPSPAELEEIERQSRQLLLALAAERRCVEDPACGGPEDIRAERSRIADQAALAFERFRRGFEQAGPRANAQAPEAEAPAPAAAAPGQAALPQPTQASALAVGHGFDGGAPRSGAQTRQLSVPEQPPRSGPSPRPSASPDPPAVVELQREQAALSAAAELPIVGRVARSALAQNRREQEALDSARAAADWIGRNVSELRELHQRLIDEGAARRRAGGLGPEAALRFAREEHLRLDPEGVLEDLEDAAHQPVDRRREFALWALRRARELMDGSSVGRLETSYRRGLEEAQQCGDAAAQRERLEQLALRRARELMDASSVGRLEASYRRGLEEAQQRCAAAQRERLAQLAELAREQPEYFEGRQAWAAFVGHNREQLAEFPEGTVFHPDELGLPARPEMNGAVTRVTRQGSAGVEWMVGGLRHFQTLDGSHSLDERRVDGQTRFVASVWNRGRLTVSTLDERLNPTVHVIFEPMEDGRFTSSTLSATDDAAQLGSPPRTIGRFVDGVFVPESIETATGVQERPDPELPELWIARDFPRDESQGAARAVTLDASALASIEEPNARHERIRRLAEWLQLHHPFQHANRVPLSSGQMRAMLEDFFQHPANRDAARRGAVTIALAPDRRIIIRRQTAQGEQRLIGVFERRLDGVTGEGQGLSLYSQGVGSGARLELLSQYTALGVRDDFAYASQHDQLLTNANTITVTGVVTARRMHRHPGGGEAPGQRRTIETQLLFEGPGIVERLGVGAAAVGESFVDIGGAVVAVSLADSPAYLGFVALAGGDAEAARRDLNRRAWANFIDNAASRRLREAYFEDERVSFDPSRRIQNVGQELALTHPAIGAALQGGVDYANGVFQSAVMVRGFGGIARYIGTLQNPAARIAGGVALQGYGAIQTAGGFSQYLEVGIEFHDALRRYDPGDPASQARYYAALRRTVSEGLAASMDIADGFVENERGRELVEVGRRSRTPDAPPASAGPSRGPRGRAADLNAVLHENLGAAAPRAPDGAAPPTRGSPGVASPGPVRSPDELVAEGLAEYNRLRVAVKTDNPNARGSRGMTPRDPRTAALADAAYQESLAVGRGQRPSPVSAEDLARAAQAGAIDATAASVAIQNGPTCTLHAWSNHLRAAGIDVPVPRILEIVARHPELGPRFAERFGFEGLSATEALAVYKAVAQDGGFGLRTIPPERLFETIAREGRGATVGIAVGPGAHQVYVEGIVDSGGRSYVSFIDSNAGGRSFMPLEDFARVVRTGGTMADRGAAPDPRWSTELAAFGREIRTKYPERFDTRIVEFRNQIDNEHGSSPMTAQTREQILERARRQAEGFPPARRAAVLAEQLRWLEAQGYYDGGTFVRERGRIVHDDRRGGRSVYDPATGRFRAESPSGPQRYAPAASPPDDAALGAEPQSPRARPARHVELLNAGREPIGEFDRVDLERGLLIEEKSALGFERRRGDLAENIRSWAELQIFNKTVNRIDNLARARATRARDAAAPSIEQLRALRGLRFEIAGDSPALRSAVEREFGRLRERYPDWEFSAAYGDALERAGAREGAPQRDSPRTDAPERPRERDTAPAIPSLPEGVATAVLRPIGRGVLEATPAQLRQLFRDNPQALDGLRAERGGVVKANGRTGEAQLQAEASRIPAPPGIEVPQVLAEGPFPDFPSNRIIVMESAAGAGLDRFLARTPTARLRQPISRRLWTDFASFVRELHRQGVSHGDLSNPENIRIAEGADGIRITLIDFGEGRSRRHPDWDRTVQKDLDDLARLESALADRGLLEPAAPAPR